MGLVEKPTVLSLAAIMIILLLLAGLIPAIITTTQGPETQTLELSNQESTDVKSPLSTILKDVDTEYINLTLLDTETGQSETITTLNITNSTNVTMRNNSINVTYTDYLDTSTALVAFDYPTLYSWGEMPVSFVEVIALLILAIFVIILWLTITNDGN